MFGSETLLCMALVVVFHSVHRLLSRRGKKKILPGCTLKCHQILTKVLKPLTAHSDSDEAILYFLYYPISFHSDFTFYPYVEHF
jgi:hypothetical protein